MNDTETLWPPYLTAEHAECGVVFYDVNGHEADINPADYALYVAVPVEDVVTLDSFADNDNAP